MAATQATEGGVPGREDGPAYALLRRLGAERMPHAAGRSLFEHLCGTAAVVAGWGLPAYVRRAALFHSVYGTGVYRRAAANDDARDTVRATIGPDAEALAHAFGALHRPRFAAAIAQLPEPAGIALADRFGASHPYAARDVLDLVYLLLANELEPMPDRSPVRTRIARGPFGSALLRWEPLGAPPSLLRLLTGETREPSFE